LKKDQVIFHVHQFRGAKDKQTYCLDKVAKNHKEVEKTLGCEVADDKTRRGEKQL
jgi:hypothetical protein